MSPDISGISVWPNFTAGGAAPMHSHGSSWFGHGDYDTIMGGGFIEGFAHGSRGPSSGSQSRSGSVSV